MNTIYLRYSVKMSWILQVSDFSEQIIDYILLAEQSNTHSWYYLWQSKGHSNIIFNIQLLSVCVYIYI